MTDVELAVARILGTANTLADVARDYGISRATLHSARKAGRLVCTFIGTGAHGIWLVDPDSLAAWMETYHPRPRRPKPEEAATMNTPLRDEWTGGLEGQP